MVRKALVINIRHHAPFNTDIPDKDMRARQMRSGYKF